MNCAATGACSVSFSFTNVNSSSSFTVYMKVQNSIYETIWQQTIQVGLGATPQTKTVNALSLGTLPPGAYIFSVFAVSNGGTVISQTTSEAFNVGGNYKLTIDPYNPQTGSISVSPSCAVSATAQSSCSFPVGTSVTVTYTPTSGYLFGQWCYWYSGSTLPPSDGCTLNGTFGQKSGQFVSQSNPLKFTMNGNYELVYSVSQNSSALNIQYFTATPVVSITGGCAYGDSNCIRGTVSPNVLSKIYSLASASYGSTSAKFTATPNANYTFANWQINGKNFTANPLSLNYSALKAIQCCGGSQVDFQVYAYFKAKIFYPLGIGAYAGISTSPAAKNANYIYPAGAKVTISITNITKGVEFTGWLVDGQGAGTGNSVTVTMDKMHNVFAQGTASSTCTATTGTTTSTYSYVSTDIYQQTSTATTSSVYTTTGCHGGGGRGGGGAGGFTFPQLGLIAGFIILVAGFAIPSGRKPPA